MRAAFVERWWIGLLFVAAAGIVAALLIAPGPGDATSAASGSHLPLGSGDQRMQAGPVKTLAPGVSYQTYAQGTPSDRWTVWAQRNGVETFGSESAAKAFGSELASEGFDGTLTTLTTFTSPASSDTPGAVIGYGLRVGSFHPESKASAERLAGQVRKKGFGARVVYTALDGEPSTGPWKVHVVRVAPTADVSVKAVHGKDISTSETVRSMAASSRALAAVNGSEFDIHTFPGFSGYEGVPQGLYVKDGVLLSAANNGRTALLLPGGGARARVTETTSTLQVTAPDGKVHPVDGVNRVPGRVAGCGGVGGDLFRVDGTWKPTLKPWRNQLCLDPDEIVMFRPEWGRSTPAPSMGVADGVDVVMNGEGVVKEVRSPAGGPIPAGSRVLQGIGAGADWLKEKAAVGAVFKFGASIKDSEGNAVAGPALSAVAGGGPALVRNGEIFVNTAANGLTGFTGKPNHTLVQRHPRTMAGVTASGELLLVTVDGREVGNSVGVTWLEAAAVMKWLGATDAIGLGSGGDATMVIDGAVANHPMDDWGAKPSERKVSTAVVVVPRS